MVDICQRKRSFTRDYSDIAASDVARARSSARKVLQFDFYSVGGWLFN